MQLDLNKDDASMILDLSKDLPNLLKLKGVLNWDPHPVHATCAKSGYDLDIFVFCLNANGKLDSTSDVIYFKNKWNSNRSIGVPVDNQTGDGDDDEYVLFNIPELPKDKVRFEVFIFIHEAVKRGQHFGQIGNAGFELVDEITGQAEVRYNLTQDYSGKTALHVGALVVGESVTFEPQGTASVAGPMEVLKHYAP